MAYEGLAFWEKKVLNVTENVFWLIFKQSQTKSLAPETPHLWHFARISYGKSGPDQPRSFDVVCMVNFWRKTMYLARLYAPITGLIFINCLFQNMSFNYVIFSRKTHFVIDWLKKNHGVVI